MILYYSQYESIDDKKDNNDNWMYYSSYHYRISWRLYRSSNNAIECREYRACSDEWPVVRQRIVEILGDKGVRWEFDYTYLYVYVRSLSDMTLLKLSYEFPND